MVRAVDARVLRNAIIVLAVGGFGIGVTEFSMMGLLQNVADDMAVSISEAGHVISAYALGVVVGAPVLATLGTRIPRKHLAVLLMVLFTVGNLSAFFAPSYPWLVVTRFIAGLPHGAYFGVAALIGASLAPATRRAHAIAMVMMGLSVANVIGVPVATWLGQTVGWRWMFVFVAAIGALAVVLISRVVPFVPADPDASPLRELGALRRPQVWYALLTGIVGFGGFFAMYSYIGPIMTGVAGLDAAWLPLVVGLYGLGMVLGNLVGGRLADRSVIGGIVIGLVITCVLLAVFAIVVHWAIPAMVMVLLIGASGSVLVPGLQARLMDVAADAQTLAAALNHSALNIANALGAFLGGLVISMNLGLVAPIVLGSVLAAAGLPIVGLSVARQRRRGSAIA
ncbi:MFS transporter [Tersicoccus sp. MR15.9]